MDKEFLDGLSQPLVDIYNSVEEQILISIAKRLSKFDSLLEREDDLIFAAWQTELLKQIPHITNENIATIAKHSGLMAEQVQEALKEAGFVAITDIDNSLIGQGFTFAAGTTPVHSAITASLEHYFKSALNDLNIVNGTMLNQADLAYRKSVTNIVANMISGTMSLQEAKRRALIEMANSGIPALIDKRGARWSPEAYVSLLLRQTANDMANKAQDDRLDEHGVDLVLITQHAGARPKCAPYQGNVYSRSGTHGIYPPLDSTSIGQPDGLFGIHCGHKKVPFLHRVTKKPDKLLSDTENARIYEESQQQRKLERDIRKMKRQESVLRAAGDDEGANAAAIKVKHKQKDMRDFIEATGRTRRRDREQI